VSKCKLLPHPYECQGKDCFFADVVEIPLESAQLKGEFSIPESLYLENNQPRIARHIAYILGVKSVEIINIKKIGYVFYDIQRSVLLDVDYKIIIKTSKIICNMENN